LYSVDLSDCTVTDVAASDTEKQASHSFHHDAFSKGGTLDPPSCEVSGISEVGLRIGVSTSGASPASGKSSVRSPSIDSLFSCDRMAGRTNMWGTDSLVDHGLGIARTASGNKGMDAGRAFESRGMVGTRASIRRVWLSCIIAEDEARNVFPAIPLAGAGSGKGPTCVRADSGWKESNPGPSGPPGTRSAVTTLTRFKVVRVTMLFGRRVSCGAPPLDEGVLPARVFSLGSGTVGEGSVPKLSVSA
jgi:hypothetical protein